MTLRILLLALLLLPAAAFASDKASFDTLNAKGAKTATTVMTEDKPKGGLKAHSTVTPLDTTKPVHSFNYAFDKDGLLGSTDMLTSLDKTQIAFAPSKEHDKLVINSTRSMTFLGTTTITMPTPHYVVLFPEDPVVWQLFLDNAAAHPHADGVYMLYFAATTVGGTSRIEPLRLTPGAEAAGTLEGKPVTLKRYELTFNKGKSTIYTDQDGRLMLADVSNFGMKHVRADFVLTP